jgi:metal-sulfur cluster biosynthetic enzyme
MEISEAKVREQLEQVLDPELNISIIDLGLVYEVKVNEDSSVHIKMTLTTLGCPLFETIEQDIKSTLKQISIPEEKVKLELTFDPPWSMERMSERGKAMLGI